MHWCLESHLREGAMRVFCGCSQLATPRADVCLVRPATPGQHVQVCSDSPWEEHPVPAELLKVDGERPHAALSGSRVVLLAARPVRGPLRARAPRGPTDVQLHVRRVRGLHRSDLDLLLVAGEGDHLHHHAQVLVRIVHPDPVSPDSDFVCKSWKFSTRTLGKDCLPGKVEEVKRHPAARISSEFDLYKDG